MSATPYEIRLDVLKLAQEMLSEEMRTKKDKLALESTMKQGTITKNDADTLLSKYDTISYSEVDVVNKAQTLYSFVTDTSTRSTRETK